MGRCVSRSHGVVGSREWVKVGGGEWAKGRGGEWAQGGEVEALGWHTREAVSGRGGWVGVFVASVNGSRMSMLG